MEKINCKIVDCSFWCFAWWIKLKLKDFVRHKNLSFSLNILSFIICFCSKNCCYLWIVCILLCSSHCEMARWPFLCGCSFFFFCMYICMFCLSAVYWVCICNVCLILYIISDLKNVVCIYLWSFHSSSILM